MLNRGFSQQYRNIGQAAAFSVFVLGEVYAITTLLGFLSLESPQNPIGDPYVSIMEILIVPLTLLYVISMVAVHAYATTETKPYGLIALCLMVLVSGISSSVHIVALTVGSQIGAASTWGSLIVSWKWPSVVYALDILAWDWFFAISILSASLVFRRKQRLEKSIRKILVVSGVLSLAGLIGIPTGNMQIRNVGIIGYAVVSPAAFLLIGILFSRTRAISADSS